MRKFICAISESGEIHWRWIDTPEAEVRARKFYRDIDKAQHIAVFSSFSGSDRDARSVADSWGKRILELA